MILSDDLTCGDVFHALEAASGTLGRAVNPTILTRQELGKRQAEKESFLTRVLQQTKVWIIGGEDALTI